MNLKLDTTAEIETVTETEELTVDFNSGEITMTRTEAVERIQIMQATEMELFYSGQNDYARSEENIFGNFIRLANMLNLDPEEVLMVYAVKHLDAILAWVNGHDSGRENVQGRIHDLRVYLAILALMAEAYEADDSV